MSNSHAKFEGLDNCTRCHELGNKVTNNKCLACHSEINQKIKAGAGFHSSQKVRGKECIVCHNEHHGRNFKLIKFEKNNFDHKETGFVLTGKHAAINCADCHNQRNIYDAKVKERKNTYLGLDQSCASCHEDYHQASLGSGCQSCHNTIAFKPAPLFNHNNAKFKLTGAHIKVNCIKCHIFEKKNGKNFTKFKGLSYQNCTPCHNDIHAGKFGTNCKKCHSDESFKNIITSKFNHSLTNFPLTGRHINIECSDCHKNGMGVKLKYGRCSDCHMDYHKGVFNTAENIPDCSKCHTVNGFLPSLFSVEDHNKLQFVLSGSHIALPCKDCHNAGENLKFKFDTLSCITCHTNIHQDEISVRFIENNNCRNCHNEDSWHKVSFDHKMTGFVLTGKHETLSCGSCHTNKFSTSIKYIFKSVQRECESCHSDVHTGQFKTAGKTECSRCHSPEGWKNSIFDHSKTNFPLTGAHKNLECGKCHKSIVAANNISYTVYKINKSKCSDCHS